MAAGVLADLILVAHTVVVLFIVGGLLAIAAGGALGWGWVRWFTWRVLHLVAMGFGYLSLPVTECMVNEVISLPVHPLLSQMDLETIVEGVNKL